MGNEQQVEERIESFFCNNIVAISEWKTKNICGYDGLTKALKVGISREEMGFSGTFFAANYLMDVFYVFPDKETMDFLAKFFG